MSKRQERQRFLRHYKEQIFFHLTSAANLAISDRSRAVRTFDLATPPLTALAFGSLISISPVAMAMMDFANWFGSRGRLGVLLTVCNLSF